MADDRRPVTPVRTSSLLSGMAAAALLAAAAVAPGSAQTGAPDRTPSPLAGLDRYMPHPPDGLPEKDVVALGRLLFFDPVLSRDSSVACVSCHQPDRAFADDRPVSVGVFGRRGTRNVPAIVNRGWGRAFFWDGRIESLEEQVLQPILASVEMDMTVEEVVARLRADPAYRRRFRTALGGDVDGDGVARALADYVRSIRAGDSPFDRAMDGKDDALTALERRGLELFQGRARCARCHTGPLLTDESFHNTGVAWVSGEPADSGRALVTGRASDVGAFKTPTLREVPLTAPYMHDGSLATLEEVVDFYDRGGHPNPHLDDLVRALGLDDADKRALLAFLRALRGRVVEGGMR